MGGHSTTTSTTNQHNVVNNTDLTHHAPAPNFSSAGTITFEPQMQELFHRKGNASIFNKDDLNNAPGIDDVSDFHFEPQMMMQELKWFGPFTKNAGVTNVADLFHAPGLRNAAYFSFEP